MSDIALFSGVERHQAYTVTFCLRFDTIDTDFFKSSPKKCQILGQGHNLQKNYRASKYSMHGVKSYHGCLKENFLWLQRIYYLTLSFS